MEKDTSPLAGLIKIIPITAVVATMAQLIMLIYYNQFNFFPLTYFEPYEIIIGSVKDIILSVLVFVITNQVLVLYIMPLIQYKSIKTLRRYVVLRQNERISQRHSGLGFNIFGIMRRELSGEWSRIFIIVLLCVIPFSGYIFTKKTIYLFSFIITVPFGVLMINALVSTALSLYSKSYYSKIKKSYLHVDPQLASVAASLIIFCTAVGFTRYEYMKDENPYLGSILTLESCEEIKCTPDLLFFGKSKNYYFLYNNQDSSVRVIKREHVKKEVLKLKEDTNYFLTF